MMTERFFLISKKIITMLGNKIMITRTQRTTVTNSTIVITLIKN